MKKTSLFLMGLVCLSTLTFAGSKSYEFVLASSAKAGSLILPAGDYKVKIDGTKAVITDVKTRKAVTTDVKIKTSERKFANTAVDSSKQGAQDRIDAIELGGSNTEIDFSY